MILLPLRPAVVGLQVCVTMLGFMWLSFVFHLAGSVEALPGFWRSMVLSWLVRPPEEESPLDIPSWLK